MEQLYRFHNSVIDQTSDAFYRFLFDEIDWRQRMIALKGPRGAGKTTLMLQRIKYEINKKPDTALYVTADHHWFYTHSLFDLAENFYAYGGRYLFIDEVHKYPNWSVELKNIYDGFPDLKVVFSSSSILDIYKGEADLSRRVISYHLPGMSFREYLSLIHNINVQAFTFEEVLDNHVEIARRISTDTPILKLFQQYLQTGYLPIITESSEQKIPQILNQVINTIIEVDLANILGIDMGSARKIKELLGVIAESVPFKPNISSLSNKLTSSRESVYNWISYLDRAELINSLYQSGKGVSKLQKPSKIYLENTNLSYCLNEDPDIGTLRETFFYNQVKHAGHRLELPVKGDFKIGDVTIEVGGKNKTKQQIADAQNGYIVSDDILTGYRNRIPLWLFGFLY